MLYASRHFAIRLAILLVVASSVAACGNLTPYHRTLPDWIESVYVPMVANESYEPGLEEIVTRALQREILADGRLALVQKHKADAVVRVTLRDYRENTAKFESDDIERARRLTMTASLELFARDDPEYPFARMEEVIVKHSYYSDYRGTQAIVDVDARAELARRAGLILFHKMMNEIQEVQQP